jgi:hypothetical protein
MLAAIAQAPWGRSQNVSGTAILLRAVSAVLLVSAGTMTSTATANADDPILHHVRYTVTAEDPFYADIYYRDTDPPNFADYSHDPFVFSPKVEADVGPKTPWVFDAMLADPYQWAMVTATSGLSPASPMFRCELAVDGVVLVTNNGPKGALCSQRAW